MTTMAKRACDFLRPRVKAKTALVMLVAGLVLVSGLGHGQVRDIDALPDWSGAWLMQGGTVFDRSTWTGGGGAITVGSRAHPPYNDEWEAIYTRHVELKDQFRFPDTNSTCGIPAGFPRI